MKRVMPEDLISWLKGVIECQMAGAVPGLSVRYDTLGERVDLDWSPHARIGDSMGV